MKELGVSQTELARRMGEGDEDAPISIESALVTAPKQTYTGTALEPDITVELDDETLKPNVDYTVTYADNKEVGTGKATITGIGKYEGEATGEFAIDHVPELDAFTDLDSNGWYLSSANGTLPDAQTYYLDTVLARGIMLGYEDNTGARTKFGPDDPVTRGQVATMLYRLSHPEATDTTDAKAISRVGNESGLPDDSNAVRQNNGAQLSVIPENHAADLGDCFTVYLSRDHKI